MLRQFNRFITLGLIVAAALYITLNNSDIATLRLGPQLTVSTYAGIIYLGVFAAGILVASLVALFFGLKSYLRERRLQSLERSRQGFFKTQEKARSLMAAEDWGAARSLWEEVIGRDPDNVVARVELSTCVEHLGDIREALKVLDSTRASSRSSSEVLFRAAYLNQKLGNNTAARDNVRLLLSGGASRKALEMARDTSEALGNYDEALKHQEALESLGYETPDSTTIRARLEYNQIMLEHSDAQSRRSALLTLIKRCPTYVPALDSLAEIELAQGNLDAGVECLIKAARTEPVGSDPRWRRVVTLWLSSGSLDPKRRSERALAAARSAAKESRGLPRLDAELLCIETLLAVNHFQEAERAIENFPSLASREVGTLPPELAHRITVLKGYCLVQTGNIHATPALWRDLVEPDSATRIGERSRPIPAGPLAEPSPALSTP